MFREDIYKLKKTSRACYMFPWDNHKLPQPWPSGYARVLIPLTEAEKKTSTKLCHCQIVRTDNLVKIQESRLRIH